MNVTREAPDFDGCADRGGRASLASRALSDEGTTAFRFRATRMHPNKNCSPSRFYRNRQITKAFSSEVDAGSREENASKQKFRARFDPIGTETGLGLHHQVVDFGRTGFGQDKNIVVPGLDPTTIAGVFDAGFAIGCLPSWFVERQYETAPRQPFSGSDFVMLEDG
jgi:hypothetical protein